MSPRSGREVAFIVLHRVADDGAFAMRALDAEIRRAQLDPREAALATETVYGALRVWPALDAALAPMLRKPLKDMDGLTRAVLRACAYQLLHLGRVPAYAIVDDAVRFIRAMRSQPSAGFVNAVLRKLSGKRPEQPEPPRAMRVPDWLQAALAESLGDARCQALLGDRPMPPPLGLCVYGTAGGAVDAPPDREALAAQLRAASPTGEVRLGGLSPRALLVRRMGDARRLPGFAEGAFAVQEEGAQLVALAAGARPGERIADLCAGHGGKSLVMASQGAQVLSVDVDERKLGRIAAEAARLGLPADRLDHRPVDLSVGLGGLGPDFDRVMVDAPCSGLGTLHRRPELMLRVKHADIARMAALQLSILGRACGLLRPGGELTYAVCSPMAAEGPGVVAALLAEQSELESVPAAAHLEGVVADADGVLRIGPWSATDGISSPDAYQVLRIRRRV